RQADLASISRFPALLNLAFGPRTRIESFHRSKPTREITRGNRKGPKMEADLRFPIGEFQRADNLTGEQRREFIDTIARAPVRMNAAVAGLKPAQLDTPYRPGGWTVRQVVHHLPDSHMNAYIRFKLALTESEPTIKPYDEKRWAELADSKAPIEPSLALLENLHA